MRLIQYRFFRDKRGTLVRYFWDSAANVLGIPSVTRGAGDAGVLKWRTSTARRFKEFLNEKPEECEFHPKLTAIVNQVYQRFISKKSTKLFQLPREMPVIFEAWGLLVLLVTWTTPRSQHSEVNCGGRNLVEMQESVVRQRETLSGATPPPTSGVEAEEDNA